MGRLAAGFAAAWLAIAGAAALAAPADDLKEAQKLYGQGKLQPALDKVEGFLKTAPKDPQGRFLKGLVLTEQKRTDDAIKVFTGLTEDYPELPEPYNNLAVLYASQGNYEKARAALELAIHTHPTYATAHENLGDICAELASRAYDRALQLDKNNTSAQVKLAMVKDLFSAKKVASRAQAAKPDATAKPEASAPAKTVAPAPEPVKPAPPAATLQPRQEHRAGSARGPSSAGNEEARRGRIHHASPRRPRPRRPPPPRSPRPRAVAMPRRRSPRRWPNGRRPGAPRTCRATSATTRRTSSCRAAKHAPRGKSSAPSASSGPSRSKSRRRCSRHR